MTDYLSFLMVDSQNAISKYFKNHTKLYYGGNSQDSEPDVWLKFILPQNLTLRHLLQIEDQIRGSIPRQEKCHAQRIGLLCQNIIYPENAKMPHQSHTKLVLWGNRAFSV